MNSEEIKVSVILPVYNVEAYIEKCLNSLRLQTIRELEFIFVDDKSPDGSIAIVESAAKEDTRIRVLYNDENMGPGPSRNRGIENAQGEYLSFIDTDDYLDTNYYEELYSFAKEKDLDVAKGHLITVDEEGRDINAWVDRNDKIKKGLTSSKPLFACNVSEHMTELFRRDFVKNDPKLRYTDTRIGEDSVLLLKVCLKNPKFDICNEANYYHLIRPDSLIGNISYESCLEELAALRNRIKVLRDYDYPKGAEEYIHDVVAYYLGRFIKYDGTQRDSIEKTKKRKMYKKQLDSALSEMPNPDNITKNLKAYKTLEDLLSKDGNAGHIKLFARKVLPKSIRKVFLRMLKN